MNNLNCNNGQAGGWAVPRDVEHLVNMKLVESRHSEKYRHQFNTYKITDVGLETVTVAEIPLTIAGILVQLLKVTLPNPANHEQARLRIKSSQLIDPNMESTGAKKSNNGWAMDG